MVGPVSAQEPPVAFTGMVTALLATPPLTTVTGTLQAFETAGIVKEI
jgi:hypothetical protein